MKNSFIVLGSNSALPTSERFSSAHIVKMFGRFFLIDCAEGAQILLRKSKISFSSLDHIFITHLHGDHYLGLFGLLSSFNLLGRKKDIHIYGPEKLKEIIDFHVKYIESDVSFTILFHPITESNKIVFEDKMLTITTISMKHRIPTFGFIFREKEHPRNIKRDKIETYSIPIKEIRKIKEGADFETNDGRIIPNSELTYTPTKPLVFAFCSDTLYNESILPFIDSADLLYHEATFSNDLLERAKETYHTTAIQAATIAQKAHVKKLAIGHFSARFKDVSILEREAKTVFENTVAVSDGMEIEIK